jgi:hypothetical protein
MPITPLLQLKVEELLAMESRIEKRIKEILHYLETAKGEQSMSLQNSLQEMVNIYGFDRYKKLANERSTNVS